MRRRELWKEVEALVEAGEIPTITLSPAAKVIMRRPPGRSRLHPVGAQRGHG
jgi:hypothetical protein